MPETYFDTIISLGRLSIDWKLYLSICAKDNTDYKATLYFDAVIENNFLCCVRIPIVELQAEFPETELVDLMIEELNKVILEEYLPEEETKSTVLSAVMAYKKHMENISFFKN